MLLTGATSSEAAQAAKASACSAVSAASVSAIVGYSVPSPTAMVDDTKATKTNFDTASVDSTCVFGAETSLKSLKTLVLLSSDAESKAITGSEFQAILKQQQKEAHSQALKLVPYSGLGVSAFYFSDTIGNIYFQGLYGFDGTHAFGAAVYSKKVSQSKLAALAKLAEKI